MERSRGRMQPAAGQVFDTHRLKGIQFGLISRKEASNISVGGGITKGQDLFDPRLGVPNKERKCDTCGGTQRGGCDRPNSCDGHFGHIALPCLIYHPHFVRNAAKVLSKVCLGCGRLLLKKKRKNGLDAIFEDDEHSPPQLLRKRKAAESISGVVSGAGLRKRKRNGNGNGVSDFARILQDIDCETAQSTMKEELQDFDHFSPVRGGLPRVCKREPVEIVDSAPPTSLPEVPMSPIYGQPEVPVAGPSNLGESGPPGVVNGGQTEPCKYCGGPDTTCGSKFPKVKLKVVGKVTARRGRIDVIKMWVDEKAGELPDDFWDFVQGHPVNCSDRIRTLLPTEALAIMNKIPREDYNKLNMDSVVSHPQSFMLRKVLVSPNCNRLIMEDWSSTLQPKILMRRGLQNSKLEAIVRKAKHLKEGMGGTRNFADIEQDSEELQLLTARHFRACKVVEFNMRKGQEIEETGGSLELKWLKANVLGKRCNQSARTIIHGDPSILIGEIGVPREIAQRLTVDEKINSLNILKWQKYINDYMQAKGTNMVGAFLIKKKNDNEHRDLEVLRRMSQRVDWQKKLRLQFGDTVTRCLRDGDCVFANRPPSLHKHSLITLKVKIHPVSTFAINPLICPPFEADFDGDAFHIFVPQSLESIAECKQLMTVAQQMICPQGGQPMISLTQDCLLAAHLLTKSHVFICCSDMQQLSMWCNSKMPIPAIVKAPGTGPWWTGKQLFSMTLPDGLNYGNLSWTGKLAVNAPSPRVKYFDPNADVLIMDGNLLICQGGSKWLERSPNGIVRAICNHAGPDVAVEHLNCIQAVLHQWLLIHGFSVGLLDYHAGLDFTTRKTMLRAVQMSLEKANIASLQQALCLDREVQYRILSPQSSGLSGTVDMTHKGSAGLLLGDGVCNPKITALQGAAIQKFQVLAPVIENIISGYMSKDNSLLAMVRSGSKGSISKLTQQAGCLGLQLYKGEKVLPVRGCSKLFYFETSLENAKAKLFPSMKTVVKELGYWESRGIIASSYLDGLNPLEFFMDSISSRCNVLRQGIEEPNQILKCLMLFMHDVHVAYDGTVRNCIGQRIIQFRYGGLREDSFVFDPKEQVLDSRTSSSSYPVKEWVDSDLAGDPVGMLAATSIAEPAYNVKMQSIHQAQLLGAGPVQLLKEILMARFKAKLKFNDRRCILRLLEGFGKEQRALQIQNELKRITLEMITLTSSIEFRRVNDKIFVKDVYKMPMMRLSPWMGHLQLCKKTIQDNNLDMDSIVRQLNKKHSGKDHVYYFSYSDKCTSNLHPEHNGLCIWFFPVFFLEDMGALSKECQSEKTALVLESMRTVMLPAILKTTVKGSDDVERVRILWEESGCAARFPHRDSTFGEASKLFTKKRDPGELVVEVVIKATKGAGKRGSAWNAVKEACIMIMELIDWSRSGPYSIQEISQSYGVEAAHDIILQRLTLVAKNMGKPVREEHLMLVADTMTHCGDVVGMGLAGYRDFCRHLSISTPFTEASFQQPKKTFLNAATRGASEGLDGVLPSAVWGTRVPVGTGVEFQIKTSVPITRRQELPVDLNECWNQLRTACNIKTSRRGSALDCHRSFAKMTGNPRAFKSNHVKFEATVKRTVFCHAIQVRDKQTLEGMDCKSRTLNLQEVQQTTFKRTLEDAIEFSDEPVSKLHRQHEDPELCRLQGDPAVLRVNDPRRVSWSVSDHSEEQPVKSTEEVRHIDNTSMDIAQEVSSIEDTVLNFPDKVSSKGMGSVSERSASKSKSTSPETVLFKNNGMLADMEETPGLKSLPSGFTKSDKKTTAETLESMQGKRSWTDEIRNRILKFFKPKADGSEKQDTEELGTGDPEISKAMPKTHLDVHMISDMYGHIGQLEAAQEYEKLIVDERKELQNLLYVCYPGERLPDHMQKKILEEVLVHHPGRDEKIGCGVDYIKVDYHPEFSTSKCFHVVRKDGSSSDFSYHKCLDAKLLKFCSRPET